ncbi:restriction endonuclease subunit S [Bacillus safensis]|uniref:restriction endonuclease subunit S n=1 Tax=Bacillus TaxID=1386 RepID=UPI0011A3F56D|nr:MULTISPECIES: restriction endonuclease subunit S [Bacillus]MBU8967507.1 restriction endonuclease subunit S [Bacillus altitudinis]MCY7431764.1 restriction endonuclease subunit S [Bacillus safensis]MCY7673008.1 restriction endonuclease subunit S [Bacillus altitudinis]MDR7667636.1 restriction endonuclease subunit S [Bacillus altitudinis]
MSEALYQKLSKIAEITMGQSPASSDCNDSGEGLPFYQGNADFGFKSPTPSRYCTKPKKTATAGDILFSVRAPVGDVNIANEECAIGRGLSAIRSVKALQQYLYFFLQFYKKEWGKVQQGSTFEAINKNDLAEMNVFAPPLQEQQKIADILSSVDETIEKTETIINQTEKVKSGLMQNLLTRGIGHTKFKETEVGEIPEKWELLSIGSIAKLQGGYAFKSKDYIAEGIQLIRISNLFGKFLNLAKDPVYLPTSYKDDYKGYVLKEGDLIICMTGTVGKEDYGHVVKIPQNSKPLLLNQRVGKFVLQNQEIDRNFLYWFLSSRLFLDVIYSFGNGTKQANLSAKQIESVLIPLPPREEQVRISKMIDSIDKKVEIEKQKLEQLKQVKKGLMQSLLTGKVRVTVDEAEVTQV